MTDQAQFQTVGSPDAAVATSPEVVPSPVQGEFQAPSPADGQTQATTPNVPDQSAAPQISREEYEAIKAELEKKDGMLSEIQTLAQQQAQQREEQKFRDQLRTDAGNVYQRLTDAPTEEAAIAILAEHIEGFADRLTGTYNEQLTAYEREVNDAFWKATAPGFADQLMREHQLPEHVRGTLLRAGNNEAMVDAALNAKETYQTLAAQFGQDIAGRRVAQMQQSGVQAMSGDAGHVAPQDIQPGSAKDLMPVLRTIFGYK